MKYKALIDKIQLALKDKKKAASPHASKSHSYAPTAALRVPQQLPSQKAPAKHALNNTDVVSKEWNDEVKHTSDYSSHLDLDPQLAANLIPERVHRWKIKDYSSIARKKQASAPSKTGEMPEKISVIDSGQDQQVHQQEKEQDELWRDLIKTQEERQFRITRITDFFS